jgi:esterase/lipase superfamily enzyme
LSYAYDRESALIASSSFSELLRILENERRVKKVNVIAHSMGNLVVMEALKDQRLLPNPLRVSELILAAPDLDRDYYALYGPEVRRIASGMTLYASSVDKALQVSRRVAGGVPRAGDVPAGGPIVLRDVDAIDVTAVGNSLLGVDHDTFSGTRSVMNDIHALLSDAARRPPNIRSIEIRAVPDGAKAPLYFRFSD